MSGFGYFQPALDEIDEALAYYKAVDPTLPVRLTRDIKLALAAIAQMPESWKPIGDGLRQKRLKSFPFVVNYLREMTRFGSSPLQALTETPTVGEIA